MMKSLKLSIGQPLVPLIKVVNAIGHTAFRYYFHKDKQILVSENPEKHYNHLKAKLKHSSESALMVTA